MTDHPRELELLFVYGTLSPNSPEEAERVGASVDSVRGRLYEINALPALVDLDDPTTEWVSGYVLRVDRARLEGPLDDYEGVGEGPYRRDSTISKSGLRVWIYHYASPLPTSAKGPLDRWEGARVVLEDLGGPTG